MNKMKTNTEPTAIEKLKEHRMQLIDFARNAGDYYLVAQLERENEEINEALSEAERKAFEAGEQFGCYEENEQLGKPDWYNSKNPERHNNQWQYKNGAKI